MDFRRRRIVKTETKVVSDLYPHDLQLYKIPPVGEISLEEFDELAVERLQGNNFGIFSVFFNFCVCYSIFDC